MTSEPDLDPERIARAQRRLSIMAMLLWANVAANAIVNTIPHLYDPDPDGFGSAVPLGLASMLVEFGLRCAFIAVACEVGRLAGRIFVATRTFDIVLAFVLPFWNLVAPFRIVRKLAEASDTSDLPPARRTIEQRGDYRQAARVERLVAPPAVPAPLVLVWQVAVGAALVVPILLTRLAAALHDIAPGAFLVLRVVGPVLQALVFLRLLQRFRARVDHLALLASPEA